MRTLLRGVTLLVCLVVGGCAGSKELSLKVSEQAPRAPAFGPSVEGVPVYARAVVVRVAVANSASISEEKSWAVFRILEGSSIPGHEGVTKIRLWYHDALLGHPFEVGEEATFRFGTTGAFLGVDGVDRAY